MAKKSEPAESWVHEGETDEGTTQHTHVFSGDVLPDGASVMETPDDGEGHSIVPQEPLPDNATETEKEIVEEE